MFSESPVLIRATRCKVPEDIHNRYHRENIPEDRVLRPYVLFLDGEANTKVQSPRTVIYIRLVANLTRFLRVYFNNLAS
jgi:hypothetical protein